MPLKAAWKWTEKRKGETEQGPLLMQNLQGHRHAKQVVSWVLSFFVLESTRFGTVESLRSKHLKIL